MTNEKASLEKINTLGGHAILLIDEKDRTPLIWMEAINRCGTVIEYHPNPPRELCLLAVKKASQALKFLKQPTEEVIRESLKWYPSNSIYVKRIRECGSWFSSKVKM